MADLGLYVYGLIADGAITEAPDLPGVDGAHAVECLRHGTVCALVSKVGIEQFAADPLREHLADMAWVEQTARRHQQVLDSVLDRCTPLPMRLCTLYNDEEGLRSMLEARGQEISAALSELDGKLEWGVQVFFHAVRSQNPDTATPRAESGTSYLQQRLAGREAQARADADVDALCDRLHADLCAIATAGTLSLPQRAEVSARALPMVLNAAYLVPNDQRERFGDRVGELGAELSEHRLELQLNGPWPPYNFVAPAAGSQQ
jgi:hypothetical protein